MISGGTIAAVGRGVERRFKPQWDALRADMAAAMAADWPDGSLPFVARAEDLANRQADASIATIRPLLAPAMSTREGKAAVKEQLDIARAEIVAKLLPGGMTVAWAKEKLAEPDAKEDAFAALVAEALGAE